MPGFCFALCRALRNGLFAGVCAGTGGLGGLGGIGFLTGGLACGWDTCLDGTCLVVAFALFLTLFATGEWGILGVCGLVVFGVAGTALGVAWATEILVCLSGFLSMSKV